MGAQVGAATLTLGLPALGPFFRAQMDLSLAALGLLLVAPTAGLAIASMAWGMLADQIGERRVMVAGLVISGCVLAAATVLPDDPILIGIALLLAGAASAAAPAASGKAVAEWFPPGERGRALSIRHTAPMAGGALAAASLPWFAAHGGRGLAFLSLSFALFGGAACASAMLSPSQRQIPLPMDEHATLGRHPIRDNLVWLMAAAGGMVVVAQGVLTRFIPEYLEAERGWGEGAAGLVLSLALVAAAVMRIAAGVISDRHGLRVVTLRTQAAAAGALLLVVGIATRGPSTSVAVILVIATGLTMAGNGVAWAAISEISPRHTGAAIGMYSTVLVAVLTLVPGVFGWIVAGYSLGPAFGWLGFFPLAGAALFALAERHRRQRSQRSVVSSRATSSPGLLSRETTSNR